MKPEEKMVELASQQPLPEPDAKSEKEMEDRAVAAMNLSIDAQRMQEEEVVGSKMDYFNKAQWLDAVTDSEFYTRDLPASAYTGLKNVAAQTAGFASDIVGVLSSVPLGGPGVLPANVGVGMFDNVAAAEQAKGDMSIMNKIPGNSEQIARAIGGDPDHPTWLPGALISPSPAEFIAGAKGAMMLGAIGVRTSGKASRIASLADFESRNVGAFDNVAWRDTGWYKGEDGKSRFFLSDADAKVNQEFFTKNPEIKRLRDFAAKTGEIQDGTLSVRLSDVLDHEALYEAYPQLRKLRLDVNYVTHPDGSAAFLNRQAHEGAEGALSVLGDNVVLGIRTDNLWKSFDDMQRVVLHEVQHAVQMIEGFASGGGARVTQEMLGMAHSANAVEGTLRLIDEGFDNIDDLYWKLVDELTPEEMIDDLLQNPVIHRYIAGDQDYRFQLNLEVAGLKEASMNEIAFVLDYLSSAEGQFADDGLDLATEMLERIGEFEDLDELAYNAYRHIYGEAEARLTEKLAGITQDKISQMRLAPNPNLLPDVSQKLSVPRNEPTQATVREFTPVDPNAIPF